MRSLLVLACCAQEPASPVRGTIEGTVADDTGTPLSGVSVQALRHEPGLTNSKPVVMGASLTDHEGRYSIAVAGEARVLLRASRRSGAVSIRYIKNGDSERPVTTMVATVPQVYYPQASVPEAATPIEVAPGAKVQHIDFKVQLPEQGTIQGFTVQEVTKN
jgi:hypothetical protein